MAGQGAAANPTRSSVTDGPNKLSYMTIGEIARHVGYRHASRFKGVPALLRRKAHGIPSAAGLTYAAPW
jgi:hypothetical protein